MKFSTASIFVVLAAIMALTHAAPAAPMLESEDISCPRYCQKVGLGCVCY